MGAEKGVTIEFDKHSGRLLEGNTFYATGNTHGVLYIFDTDENKLQPMHVACVADLKLWYGRLNHAFQEGIEQMSREKVVSGLCLSENSKISMCEACTSEKHTRSEIPRKAKHSKVGILDKDHSDVCGPLEETSERGTLYFITFINKAARGTTVYPSKRSLTCLLLFKIFWHTQIVALAKS